MLGGLGRFRGRSVVVLGTEKGADTESRVKHNFGMARPEGYRKARRLIELAGRFGLPVLTFVDTSGAFPGIDAEARGQAEAIARSIEACLEAPVPFVATIIGEGGSGGAIALAAGDRVLMLEHAIYSVISPEGCASILWRDAAQAASAAEALRLTAEDLKRLALVDVVIPEPLGGAQRDAAATIAGGGRRGGRCAAAAGRAGRRDAEGAAAREVPGDAAARVWRSGRAGGRAGIGGRDRCGVRGLARSGSQSCRWISLPAMPERLGLACAALLPAVGVLDLMIVVQMALRARSGAVDPLAGRDVQAAAGEPAGADQHRRAACRLRAGAAGACSGVPHRAGCRLWSAAGSCLACRGWCSGAATCSDR